MGVQQGYIRKDLGIETVDDEQLSGFTPEHRLETVNVQSLWSIGTRNGKIRSYKLNVMMSRDLEASGRATNSLAAVSKSVQMGKALACESFVRKTSTAVQNSVHGTG